MAGYGHERAYTAQAPNFRLGRKAAESVWSPNRSILAELPGTNRCEFRRLNPQQRTFESLISGVGR